LSPGLDLNECVAILNKINTIGLIPFVKTYLELKENELTGLQALSDVSEKVSTKMSKLIQHISSIKQWLFLND
jgi:hypothetical protein